MEDKQQKFRDLVKTYPSFVIPAYQRAYAWEVKQLKQFINDLEEQASSQYYLGHYILEENNDAWDIVDGQQRLTTIALFYAVCRSMQKIDAKEYPPIHLTIQDYDNKFFQRLLKNEDVDEKTAETTSQKRMLHVFKEIKKDVKLKNIERYLSCIYDAYVSVAIYGDKAVAAQIFELHNTRGVPLSEVEKVKAMLMKYVYTNSTGEKKDSNVKSIQEHFASIFKMEESAKGQSFRGEMSLDELLMHHLRAVDDGNKAENFSVPSGITGEEGVFAYVKNKLDEFKVKEEGIAYAKNLSEEFAKTLVLVSETLPSEDAKNKLVRDIILLDKNRSMIFLLRYFRSMEGTKPDDLLLKRDDLLLKRWETFLLMWDWHSHFYNMKAGKKDSFDDIYKKLTPDHYRGISELLRKYYTGELAFAHRGFRDKGGLGNLFKKELQTRMRHAYGGQTNKIRYILYKYESENDKCAQEKLRYVFKSNKVTLDHIVAQGIAWDDLKRNGRKKEEWWENKIQPIINSIGNLLLIGHSDNAKLGNTLPEKKVKMYEDMGFTSHSYKNLKNWVDEGDNLANHIREREQKIQEFIEDYFPNEEIWKNK